MSASLIGRLGSSAFRLFTTAVTMSLAGSCFSSESRSNTAVSALSSIREESATALGTLGTSCWFSHGRQRAEVQTNCHADCPDRALGRERSSQVLRRWTRYAPQSKAGRYPLRRTSQRGRPKNRSRPDLRPNEKRPEGIEAARLTYRAGRSPHWIKIKNRKHRATSTNRGTLFLRNQSQLPIAPTGTFCEARPLKVQEKPERVRT